MTYAWTSASLPGADGGAGGGAVGDDVDVALPEIGGYRQPLAAAYRVELLRTVAELVAADRLRLNEPADYERAHALTAPEIQVEWLGPLAAPVRRYS